MIQPSANGCSRSRTAGELFLIFPLCCSSSSSLKRFAWKSSTCHSGVSRRRRWSRAKWRFPWKCRNTLWCPCVSTETSFWRPTVKMAWHIDSVWWSCHEKPAKLSCSVHLLHVESFLRQKFPGPLAGVFLISAVFWHLKFLWTLRWPLFKTVQHFIQFCQYQDVYCTPKTKVSISRQELLIIHQGRQQLCFPFLANGATEEHHPMTSGTNHSGSRIGDELTWKAQKWWKFGVNMEQYQ